MFLSGEKVVGDVPLTRPSSTALMTALRYQALPETSVKSAAACTVVGLMRSTRHRNRAGITAAARTVPVCTNIDRADVARAHVVRAGAACVDVARVALVHTDATRANICCTKLVASGSIMHAVVFFSGLTRKCAFLLRFDVPIVSGTNIVLIISSRHSLFIFRIVFIRICIRISILCSYLCSNPVIGVFTYFLVFMTADGGGYFRARCFLIRIVVRKNSGKNRIA